MTRRFILGAAALLVAWLVVCAVLFVWPSAASTPRHADAVVVLSGGGNDRLDPAIRLVRDGVAPVLVISSPAQDPHWFKAKRLCRLRRLADGKRVICFEASPYSTEGEAKAIAGLARSNGWKHVVVVSSTYHLTRARLLVRRCYKGGLSMVGARSLWWRLPEAWATETAKLLVQLTLQRAC